MIQQIETTVQSDPEVEVSGDGMEARQLHCGYSTAFQGQNGWFLLVLVLNLDVYMMLHKAAVPLKKNATCCLA